MPIVNRTKGPSHVKGMDVQLALTSTIETALVRATVYCIDGETSVWMSVCMEGQ